MRLRSTATPGRTTAAATPQQAAARRPIGRILNIEPSQADAVAERQGQTGRLFGETAVEMGVASETAVRRAIEEQQGFSVLPEGDERIDPLIVAAFDPDDALSRSVRQLRSSITRAQRPDGSAVRSVALLGMEAAAETSILAGNLAVASAQAGYQTLLVDANLTHPQQQSMFRANNRAGLSTLLSTGDGADLLIQPTAIPMLSLMTAGPAVPNAPELLERQRFSQCADQLIDGFDFLIADVANADGDGIAACLGLDAAIVVVRRDVSGMRPLQDAIDQLEKHGTPRYRDRVDGVRNAPAIQSASERGIASWTRLSRRPASARAGFSTSTSSRPPRTPRSILSSRR